MSHLKITLISNKIDKKMKPLKTCIRFEKLTKNHIYGGVKIFQAFLANEDLGDSLDSVEALFKKHDDFEKSLAAQEEKIKVSLVTELPSNGQNRIT